MRIAIFTDTFPPQLNGVATYTYELAKWMSRKHEVAVFTMGNKTTYEDMGFEVYKFKGSILHSYPQFTYRAIPPYREVIPLVKEFSPDIVHSHTPITMGAVAELASRRLKVPLIANYHTALIQFIKLILDSSDQKALYLRIPLIRKMIKKVVDIFAYPGYYYYFDDSDRVIAPSQFVVEDLIKHGISEKKITKIPNFIKMPKKHMSGEKFREKWGINEFMVLHVGRLSWEKRIEKVIEAVNGLDRVKLVITSKGPHENALKNYAKKIGAENVIFTGFLPESELFGAYEACDVFITASPFDTFNLSAAHALAFGKPVIGIKSGITEFVKHGKNGFIVEDYEKEVEKYRKWIKLLKENEELKKEMGKRAKEEAKRLDIGKIMPKIEKVYKTTEYEKYKRRRYIYYLSLILLMIRATRV